MGNGTTILEEIGSRSLAYGIFSLIAEHNEIVVITPNQEIAENISMILEDIISAIDMRLPPSSELSFPSFNIRTLDEYKREWQKYIGKRLIFIEEDRNFIAPIIDHLEFMITEMIESKSRDPIRRIAVRISDIFSSIETARYHYKSVKEGKMDEKEFNSLLTAKFPRKLDAKFALEVLKILNASEKT